jgi:hypothetical protein
VHQAVVIVFPHHEIERAVIVEATYRRKFGEVGGVIGTTAVLWARANETLNCFAGTGSPESARIRTVGEPTLGHLESPVSSYSVN